MELLIHWERLCCKMEWKKCYNRAKECSEETEMWVIDSNFGQKTENQSLTGEAEGIWAVTDPPVSCSWSVSKCHALSSSITIGSFYLFFHKWVIVLFLVERQGWRKCAFSSVTKTACLKNRDPRLFFCSVVTILRSRSEPSCIKASPGREPVRTF